VSERDAAAQLEGERGLARVIGRWGLAAGIVNVTVGGGIFRLPSGVAAEVGAAAPLAYLACTIAMGLIVLCFAEAGSRVSLTGGLYAYVEVAFGPLIGFLCGVMLWAGITAATAAVTSFFADALGALVPPLASEPARTASIVTILAALAALNIAGVRGASRFNAVMTVAKLLPLIALVVVGASAVRGENLRWTSTPATPDVARASVVLIFDARSLAECQRCTRAQTPRFSPRFRGGVSPPSPAGTNELRRSARRRSGRTSAGLRAMAASSSSSREAVVRTGTDSVAR